MLLIIFEADESCWLFNWDNLFLLLFFKCSLLINQVLNNRLAIPHLDTLTVNTLTKCLLFEFSEFLRISLLDPIVVFFLFCCLCSPGFLPGVELFGEVVQSGL